MKAVKAVILAFMLCWAFAGAILVARADVAVPPLTARVVDLTGTLSSDQVAALGHRDELRRRDRPVLRVLPTQQRLGADHGAVFDAPDRLVHHLQFATPPCAAQLVLSYFIAGISKLRDPAWLRGTALPQLVQLPQYAVPAWAAALLSRPTLAALAAWAMLAFECASPAALVDPTVCAALLAFGATFHLVNAIVFGLNRFLWAWPAAYPALVYWAAHARTPW